MSKTTPDRGPCTIDDCTNRAWSRGMCHKHYQRWRKHGDPRYISPKMMRSYCTIDGCDRAVNSGGLCSMHVRRLRKFGTTDDPKRPVAERFWEKVNKDGPEYADLGKCWEWTAARNENGYGIFGINNKPVRAHRWSYEQAVESIPDGHDIDHICGDRACVNPDHLRDATRKQNMENYTVRNKLNKTGYRGVHKQGNSYIAQVTHNGYTTHVGSFSTAAEAGEAARRVRVEMYSHNDRDRSA